MAPDRQAGDAGDQCLGVRCAEARGSHRDAEVLFSIGYAVIPKRRRPLRLCSAIEIAIPAMNTDESIRVTRSTPRSTPVNVFLYRSEYWNTKTQTCLKFDRRGLEYQHQKIVS